MDHTERIHKFSHDLRNRLIGLHEAIKHVAVTEGADKQEIIEYGEQQFFKALREIESLMDDLEIVRGEQHFEVGPVPLAEVTREAAEHLQHRFEGKQQELKFDLDPTVMVNGDRHFITGSIASLLSNASKFSPKNSPIEVTMERRGDQVRLCVVDKGVGLTQEDLKNLFTRYAWLNSRSTNGEAQGRSSLALSYKWAQGMGGDLSAYSEGEGKGCSFALSLPIAK